ncbi:MAG: hypothetical protein M1160_00790 [Candidatus Marsarchaeota archaeon]|jgi:hypothetical protein|nr:hypothetical protein [Candidatus Marsarchaeota archaeon]MCL5111404.1 hypothetical protein [Candidatus Marsarchaeota archaeon]
METKKKSPGPGGLQLRTTEIELPNGLRLNALSLGSPTERDLELIEEYFKKTKRAD